MRGVIANHLPIDFNDERVKTEKGGAIIAANRVTLALGRDPGPLSGRPTSWTMAFPIGEKKGNDGRTSVLLAQLTGYAKALTIHEVKVRTRLWELAGPFGRKDPVRAAQKPEQFFDEGSGKYVLAQGGRTMPAIEVLGTEGSRPNPLMEAFLHKRKAPSSPTRLHETHP